MATHSGSGQPTLRVELDAAAFRQLMKDARAFSPELSKQLRKSIRDAAKPAIRDVQNEIRSMPSRSGGNTRDLIAKSVKLSIKTSKREAGVTIQSTGSKLPVDKRPLARAFNKPSFRRRVYGKAWVEQSGRPYFGAVLDEKKRDMEKAVEDALNAAIRTIRAGTPQS